MFGCENTTISNNNCTFSTSYGIRLAFSDSTNTLVSNNCSYSGGDGISLKGATNNMILDNDCTNAGKYGILLNESISNTLSQNNCSNFGEIGIMLDASNQTIIINNFCQFNDFGGAGIFLINSTNNSVSINDCSYNSFGIVLGSSTNTIISDNNCFGTLGGIMITQSSNLTVSGNNCSETAIGIMLVVTRNLIVLENNCSYNNIGIYLHSSTYDTIDNNYVSFNEDCGILLAYSHNNAISGNTIADNENIGINLTEANYNQIWENKFLGNQFYHAFINDTQSVGNQWDNGGIGNFWSDYQIQNPNAIMGDGMWSLAYRINGTSGVNDVDRFPSVTTDFDTPEWVITPADQTIEVGLAFNYDVGAVDNVAIDYYWLGDTPSFHIDENGIITNQTTLLVGEYSLTISVNDTGGNKISITITVTVIDVSDPTWVQTPTDQTLDEGISFSYDINATDNVGIDQYWLGGAPSFRIDENGVITNQTTLIIGEYSLTISVNDTVGNEISITISLTVTDVSDPTWVQTPTDLTLDEGIFFSYDINATDNVEIDQYWLGDTPSFHIDENGIITNQATLLIGEYSLTIYVNDTGGNNISITISLTINDVSDPTWAQTPSDQTLGEGISLSYDINATDNVGIDHYWLSDTTSFTIDGTGLITNKMNLPVGILSLTIGVNDTSGNFIQVTISITVVDITAPTWVQTPIDITVPEGTLLSYKLNVTDNVGVTGYSLSNTTYFEIDASGLITNNTIVPVGNYTLTIEVKDAAGNVLSVTVTLTIESASSTPSFGGGIPGYSLVISVLLIIFTTGITFHKNLNKRKKLCSS
jgi:parallel beta-helix repeat protein